METAGVLPPQRPAAGGAVRPWFDPPNVLWFFGSLAAGSTSAAEIAGIPKSGHGVWVFLTALGFIAAFLLLAWVLLQRQLWLPAGLMAWVAAALVPMAVYGFERLIGTWPHSDFEAFDPIDTTFRSFSGNLTALAAAGAVAGLLAFGATRLHFTLALTAFWLLVLPQIVVSLVTDDFANRDRVWLVIASGAVLVGLGLALDLPGRRRSAFWFHVFGLLGVAIGLLYFTQQQHKTGAFVAVTLLGAVVVIGAALLRRATWAAYGTLGVYSGLFHFLDDATRDRIAPLLITFVGLGLVALGIAIQRRSAAPPTTAD